MNDERREAKRGRALSRLAAHVLLACAVAGGAAGCAVLGGLPSAARPVAPAAVQDTLEERAAAIELADALYRAGKWPEAQGAYEKLAAQYPRNAHVWLRLGNTLARQNRLEDAAAALQNAVLVEGTNGPAAFNLGLVRLAQAQSAFDYARTRLGSQPGMRQQATVLHARVESLLAELDSIAAKEPARAAALNPVRGQP